MSHISLGAKRLEMTPNCANRLKTPPTGALFPNGIQFLEAPAVGLPDVGHWPRNQVFCCLEVTNPRFVSRAWIAACNARFAEPGPFICWKQGGSRFCSASFRFAHAAAYARDTRHMHPRSRDTMRPSFAYSFVPRKNRGRRESRV